MVVITKFTTRIPINYMKKVAIHQNEGIGYELHGLGDCIMDEWKIIRLPTPFGSGDWELYNLAEDPSETIDLSGQFPDIRNELIAAREANGKEVRMV